MISNLQSPLISVIIPTHNRAQELKRSVESVLKQTRQDFEIIIISDGSTDNTPDTVTSFNDPRIRFFQHEVCKGASAARNTGLRAAKGKYIAFLDDDDEWLPTKLEKQLPVIEKSPPEVGLVYAWMEYFKNGESRGLRAPELRGNVFVEMLDKQAIGGCPTIIIKREVIERIGFFDESLPRGNDGNYWRRITKYYNVDFVPKVLANVHLDSKNRISHISKRGLQNEVNTLENRLEIFKSDFDSHLEQKVNILTLIGMDYLLIAKPGCFFKYMHMMADCDISWKNKTVCFGVNLRKAFSRLRQYIR